jgi:RHS repeat-associated protein
VLAPDPVINGSMGQDGANRYAYVYNHPTTFIDPSGFDGFY